MSYTAFWDSFLRSSLIALAALYAGVFIVKFLSPWRRGFHYILLSLFICFFIPPVAVGYGYTTLSYKLIQYPLLHEIFYSLLMVGRLIGIAATLIFYLPLLVSRESSYCLHLAVGKNSLRYFKYIFLGSIWRYVSVFILLFLLAFSDFELASIMNVEHWAVSLFDAHAQGLSVPAAFRITLTPFLLQFIMIIVLLIFFRPALCAGSACEQISLYELTANIHRRGKYGVLNIYISAIIVLFLFIISLVFPLFMILKSAFKGGVEAFFNLWMMKEILNSLMFGGLAALAAYLFSMLLRRISFMRNKIVIMIIFLPALIGVLPLSLMILQLFQLSLLHHLYNSPIPLLLALILWILPFSLILQFAADKIFRDESLHSATLMLPFSPHHASELLWSLRFKRSALILFSLFTLAYFNFTAAAILAPVGMTTVTERFYNLMHYGESEKLSATVCVTIVIPLLLFALFSVIFKMIIKRYHSFGR